MPNQTLPAATLPQAWDSFWANLFNFKGRSTRAEFWWMILLGWIAQMVLLLPALILPFGSGLVGIAYFVLTLALFVRRFHDAGWSTGVAVSTIVTVNVLSVLALGLLTTWLVLLEHAGNGMEMQSGHIVFLIAAGICWLACIAVGLFSFIVALMPSKPDNKYGPQRAGRVPATPQTPPEPRPLASDTDPSNPA